MLVPSRSCDEGTRAALFDVAMRPSPEDGNVTFGMDEGGFVGHDSDHDTTLSPAGIDLWQPRCRCARVNRRRTLSCGSAGMTGPSGSPRPAVGPGPGRGPLTRPLRPRRHGCTWRDPWGRTCGRVPRVAKLSHTVNPWEGHVAFGEQPAYLRVAGDLRRKILDGTLPPHARLPSQARIRSEYGVSDTVALEARKVLMAEGYVEGRSGSGTYVRERPKRQRDRAQRLPADRHAEPLPPGAGGREQQGHLGVDQRAGRGVGRRRRAAAASSPATG